MFSVLCDDLLLMVLFNLTNIHDVINFASVDKTNNSLISNDIYIYWGRYMYSKEFWDKASKRTISISKPLVDMKISYRIVLSKGKSKMRQK